MSISPTMDTAARRAIPPLPSSRSVRWRLLVAAGVLLLAVFALYGWLRVVGPLPGDRAAAQWWRDWSPASLPGGVRAVLSGFDAIGTPYVAVALTLALAAVVYANAGARSAALVVAAAGVALLNAGLKLLFGTTPLWQELDGAGHEFPSGHVAFATALFGLVAIIAARRGRRTFAVALVLAIVAMGVARVVAKAHLPSDVIGGYLVGAAWVSAILALGLPQRAPARRVE